VAGSTRAIFILQRFLLLPREAVQINMGAELQQEEELSRLASADLVLRIFLRYLKRYQARLSTKFKYDFLGRDVVENVLPDPHAFRSKRSWEAAMHYARIVLREMAVGFDSASSIEADHEGATFQADCSCLVGIQTAGVVTCAAMLFGRARQAIIRHTLHCDWLLLTSCLGAKAKACQSLRCCFCQVRIE
jgi:hypothetical protein